MKKLSMLLTALAGVALLAPAAFAQGGEAAGGAAKSSAALVVAAIFGVGIAAKERFIAVAGVACQFDCVPRCVGEPAGEEFRVVDEWRVGDTGEGVVARKTIGGLTD